MGHGFGLARLRPRLLVFTVEISICTDPRINVRSYMKKTIVQVPETAPHRIHFFYHLKTSCRNYHLLSLLDSPFHELGYLNASSSQLRMIQSPQDDTQKLASKFRRLEELLKDSGFDSVGELLKVLFYCYLPTT